MGRACKGQMTKKTWCEKFECFWKVYPFREGVKEGKGIAKKHWNLLQPSEELFKTIMSALDDMKEGHDYRKDPEGKFLPMAKTFVKEKRWEVETEGQETNPAQTGCTIPGTDPVSSSPSLRQQYLAKIGY